MNPFFFGDSAQPLYGVYHPPNQTLTKDHAILLCPPFGQEYMRSHRAFRQLAILLNKKGYGVLRFDYRGTGDSFGDEQDSSVSDWQHSIETAVEELKHTAQVSQVSLIGLRLGALLATSIYEKVSGLQKLVLWDPVVAGQIYIEELKSEMPEKSLSNFVSAEGNLHFNGYTLFKDQIDDLSEFDLRTQKTPACRTIQICSSENQFQEELKAAWQQNEQFTYNLTPAPGDWNFVDDFGGILLPQQIIQAIVGYFE